MPIATYKMESASQLDAIIIGAGIAGVSALYHLRKAGIRCQILEKGNDIGGVWHWCRYPGARIDSGLPSYLVNIPECWKTWEWSSSYPNDEEMRRFFDHCDQVVHIREHVRFNTTVVGAEFDPQSCRWTTTGADGAKFESKYLISAVGCTSRRAEFLDSALEPFRGQVIYPGEWPHHPVSPVGKDVAVIGTGSSGVQITQTWGPLAKSLTVYQRSYNTALPMASGCEALSREFPATQWEECLRSRLRTPAGLVWQNQGKSTFEDSPEAREKLYEELLDQGALSFWIRSYNDLTTNTEANRLAHRHWAKRVRDRIHDPLIRDILAPLEPKHPFGIKRPAIDDGYYDQFNRDTVSLVDLTSDPIAEFTATGVKMKSGIHRSHDIIIPAIGFMSARDTVSGLGIKTAGGQSLSDLWKEQPWTYLGIMIHEMPNLFIVGGPQAPTEKVNVPTSIDVQVQWIARVVKKLEKQNTAFIRPSMAAVRQWNDKVNTSFNWDVYRETSSRYMSKGRPCYFGGGIPRYITELEEAFEAWQNFEIGPGNLLLEDIDPLMSMCCAPTSRGFPSLQI